MCSSRPIHGRKSTGSRSIAFIRKTQQNTVRASGAMKVRSPLTSTLACSLTMSTSISTAAWKRPGTPEVARRAASHSTNSTIRPQRTEKNTVSRWTTEKSSESPRLAVLEVVEVVVDVTRQPPFVATLTRHPALLAPSASTASPTVPRHRPRCRVGAPARGDAWHYEPATEGTGRLSSPRAPRIDASGGSPLLRRCPQCAPAQKRRESISGPFALLQITRCASETMVGRSAACNVQIREVSAPPTDRRYPTNPCVGQASRSPPYCSANTDSADGARCYWMCSRIPSSSSRLL